MIAASLTRVARMGEGEIQEAARLVTAGGLVAYPTDTVYGLGCNPFDAQAVKRLIAAKHRVKGSLPVLISSLVHAKELAEFNTTSMELARRFWPGPLTLVIPARQRFPEGVTEDSTFVGLRIPNFPKTESFIEKCGGRIIGTSANISGHASPRTAQMVVSELEGRIDLVLDGGQVPLGKESTVVKVFDHKITVLREGVISSDDIHKAVNAPEPV